MWEQAGIRWKFNKLSGIFSRSREQKLWMLRQAYAKILPFLDTLELGPKKFGSFLKALPPLMLVMLTFKKQTCARLWPSVAVSFSGKLHAPIEMTSWTKAREEPLDHSQSKMARPRLGARLALSVMMSLILASSSLFLLSEAQIRQAERIETTTPMVFSNHNVNLNNVGLDDNQHPTDLGPKLEGPNVCTKQEA